MTENYSNIPQEVDRINSNISDAYDSAEALGATMPQTRNSTNLANSILSLQNGAIDTFIPANTILTVELDGSGDFTTLSEALTYLRSHWSNGRVILYLSDGIHTFNESLYIGDSNSWQYRYPYILITSQSGNPDSCILHFNLQNGDCAIYIQQIALLRFSLLSFESNEHNYNTTKYWGIQGRHGSKVQIAGCKLNWLDNAITADFGSQVHIFNNIEISNSYAALVAQRSGRLTSETLNLTLNNVRQGVYVGNGGIAQLHISNKSFTDVIANTSQEVGICSKYGIIIGNI